MSIAAGRLRTGRGAPGRPRACSPSTSTSLMLIAVVGAIAIGEWSEAATVTFLFALAQWIESRNMERARLAIRALMELSPNDALVRRDGQDVRVPVDSVVVGDVARGPARREDPARRRGGGRRERRSTRRRSPASRCRSPRRPGDEVFAGTINGHGALDGRA
ncbi:MAG: hypothetical protein MZU84_04665 [Sphingobacterium sp.]|nr:hypothetical protein [Sphingobacterium sp.]